MSRQAQFCCGQHMQNCAVSNNHFRCMSWELCCNLVRHIPVLCFGVYIHAFVQSADPSSSLVVVGVSFWSSFHLDLVLCCFSLSSRGLFTSSILFLIFAVVCQYFFAFFRVCSVLFSAYFDAFPTVSLGSSVGICFWNYVFGWEFVSLATVCSLAAAGTLSVFGKHVFHVSRVCIKE